MSARDDLAYQVFRADNRLQPVEDCREDWAALVACHGTTYAHHIADGLIDAGYRKPEQITTTAELYLLPLMSVVTRNGVPYTKTEEGWQIPGTSHAYAPKSLLLDGNATLVYFPPTSGRE